MTASTIAIIILLLLVYIFLVCSPIGAELVAFTGILSLIAGLIAIITCSVLGGWYLFFAILWEVIWAGIITLVPSVSKIISQRI